MLRPCPIKLDDGTTIRVVRGPRASDGYWYWRRVKPGVGKEEFLEARWDEELPKSMIGDQAYVLREPKEWAGDPYRDIYNTIRWQAPRRGITWSLGFYEWKHLAQQDCYYCEAPPSNGLYQVVQYQGIDRINSDGDYTLDNVVPCCKWCNQGKSTLSAEEYVAHCQRVAQHAQSKVAA